ncbi:MAG TPA: pseudaminic acid synthase [Opitutaceae bacterium]|nr:pseudaminic acid synthase [Opitutaceae bacterium]
MTSKPSISIGARQIGPSHPCYIIAELSANHGQDFNQAVEIIKAAKDAGADAIKLQTYRADTITLDCDNEYFRAGDGTLWQGRRLYELYDEAHTPWEWQPRLKAEAERLGLDCFSTPFDLTAVDFLEKMAVKAYKIASFEIVDLPLIAAVARTGKPAIISTGMATFAEIEEAVRTFWTAGGCGLALLKCTSSYPAKAEEMNLRTIPHLAAALQVPVGLSDHTLGTEASIAAVALGANIVEKHLTISRQDPGPDSAFSLEPIEFKLLVDSIRIAERTLGEVRYEPSPREAASRVFRKSLFAVRDIGAGEVLTAENIRSIRPGHGLHPRHLPEVLGRKAAKAIPRGTPLGFAHLEPR